MHKDCLAKFMIGAVLVLPISSTQSFVKISRLDDFIFFATRNLEYV